MSGWNTAFLPAGQWILTHDLSACAGGSAPAAAALAKSAGARGLLVKVLDGATPYTAGGSSDLLAACQAAGLECSGWGYVYPGDGAPTAALIAAWLTASGNTGFLLDAEVEFEATGGAAAAATLLDAVKAVCDRPWYTSLPWPDQQSAFPWSTFQGSDLAFAPQIYFATLAGTAGAQTDAWAATCWNRAAVGPKGGGPSATNGGPAGWEGLAPALPVVPIFDLSNISKASALAYAAGMPAICWWLLDGMTAAQAAALAETPYAVAAVTPPPPAPPPPPPPAPAPAPVPAPAAPTPPTAADISAALAALSQAQAALTAAQQALGG